MSLATTTSNDDTLPVSFIPANLTDGDPSSGSYSRHEKTLFWTGTHAIPAPAPGPAPMISATLRAVVVAEDEDIACCVCIRGVGKGSRRVWLAVYVGLNLTDRRGRVDVG